MKLFRKIIDERQELEMMRVERGGFWVLYLGLAVAATVQIFTSDFNIANIAGEFIVLMVGCVVVAIGHMQRGSWDYFTKPGIKSYLIYSAVASVIISIIVPIVHFLRDGASFLNCFFTFAINIAFWFPFLFFLLWFLGYAVKKRQAKLQKECEEDTQ